MTQRHVEAKVGIVNRMLGFDPDSIEYLTVGAIRLDGAYGGWAVHRVVNEHGGCSDLTGGHGPLREAAEFLDGMIAALRIVEERAS